MEHMETISDAALDQVTGGLDLSFSFDWDEGLKVGSPLGDISVGNPITVATDLIKNVAPKVGDVISRIGNRLVDLGQLFNFS